MNNLLVSGILIMVCIGSVSSLTCFYCANCPVPFDPYGYGVQRVSSNTGFCMKQSIYSYSGAPASRGAAIPYLCNYDGCGRSGSNYVCCCSRSFCNTGSLTSKSTISVLLGTLTLLVVKQFF